ncbi:Rieske 2Fe-2S domain-containing protein [Streptomyces sp. NPDC046909]|uniref:Rieske 2Fe-2S domain-containing protein n=1 Tax=Streptomyces sp. NPDC046909 TaxID=3155617 RepID=UPI0033C0C5AC
MTTVGEAPAASRAGRAPAPVAPLIREAWYVVAARDEVDRTLRQRWVLGEPVCFYRTEDGTAVVLDDRCAHRRFPLSRSRLEGDTVRCGYHGFAYGPDGQCVSVPGADPGGIRVRSYPVVERGPWVWIWTGADPTAADPDLIPWPTAVVEGGEFVTGYSFDPTNYNLVHENLLDLTHLQFLHGVGQSEFTEAAPVLLGAEQLPRGFAQRSVGYAKELTTTLGAFAIPVGVAPSLPVDRSGRIISVLPALNYAIDEVTPHDPAATPLRRVVIAHCLTPADLTSTHQFWTWWQDVPFAIPRTDMTAFITRVFNQDVEAFTWTQEYIDRDTREGVVEQSVPADVPGLRVRRQLHRLAAAERG